MFIQVEETPNPNSLKFFPGKIITKGEIIEYTSAEQASQSSKLATELFAIQGITNIMFNIDYIAISKNPEIDWGNLKPIIINIIMNYFLKNDNTFIETIIDNTQSEFFDKKDTKIIEAIKELIDTHIRHNVARDGGDIQFRGYKDGIVYLSLHGACSGCPSAQATLKQGVENLLRHFIPQIIEVKAI